MLRDPTESATTLPFSAGETGACRYEVSTAPRDEVLYHAFVYLRYILSDRAPEDARLLPTLNLILREPHRLWRSHRRDVRIEALTRVDAHTPFDLLTRTGTAVLPSSLSPSGAWLAGRLNWSLPDNRYPREPVREGLRRAGSDHHRSHAVCGELPAARRVSTEPAA